MAALMAREEAFHAAVAANPELYKSLKQAARDTRKAFNEVDAKYRKLERAQTAARQLKVALEDCEVDAREFMYSVTLLASIGKRLQPILQRRNEAIDTVEAAENALNEHFPDHDLA
jgi:phage-related tail protein